MQDPVNEPSRVKKRTEKPNDKEATAATLPKRKYKLTGPLPSIGGAAGTEQPFRLDAALLGNVDFAAAFREHWHRPDSDDANSTIAWPAVGGGTQLLKYPFTLVRIAKFLQTPSGDGAGASQLSSLVDEMVHMAWQRNRNDLYEFYQTTDLANACSPLLGSFHRLLRTVVMPLVARLTGLQLTNVSASCSMYTCGDRLLVHDDRLGDRRVAYVYYVSPWPDTADWTDSMGGALELFAADSAGQRARPMHPAVRKLRPRNNQFVFFPVGSRSFHAVGEVCTMDTPRFTINGWFHGPAAPAAPKRKTDVPRPAPAERRPRQRGTGPNNEPVDLTDNVRATYLRQRTKVGIHRVIESASHMSLVRYFVEGFYEKVSAQLDNRNDRSVRWQMVGPADRRHYERLVLDGGVLNGAVRELCSMLRSTAFFRLLFEYTELDLAGRKAKRPTCTMEVRRLRRESYSLLDDASTRTVNQLDLIVYFGAPAGCPVGTVNYVNALEMTRGGRRDGGEEQEAAEEEDDVEVEEDSDVDMAEDAESDEDDDDDDDDDDDGEGPYECDPDSSMLLEVTPMHNTLNLVYRRKGTAQFLQYASKRTLKEGEYVYMVIASYRE